MREFSTDSFDFLGFDEQNSDHQEFFNIIYEDELIVKSISRFYLPALKMPEFLRYRHYLVANESDDLIGFMILENKDSDIWYSTGLIEGFRGTKDQKREGLGSKVIREASNYLIGSHKELRYVRAKIESQNIASVKSAINAGFKLLGEDSEYEYYVKQSITDFNPDAIRR